MPRTYRWSSTWGRVVRVAPVWLVLMEVAPAVAQPPAVDRAASYREFLLGLHHEGAGDNDSAIAALREAAGLDPGAAEPLAELAGLYARSGQRDEAIAVAEEALAREADNLTAHRILGLTYASAAGSREGTPDAAARAVTHLEQARGSVVPDLQVELTLARLYLRTDAAGDAVEVLEGMLRDNATFVEAALLLAQAYEQTGREDDALTLLETVALGTRPSYRVMARLGELYERGQRWREAAAAYEQAVRLNPRNAAVRRRLAGLLLEIGEGDRARGVLEELIEMRPRDAAGLYLLAEVELDGNRFDAAESLARQLIEVEPDGIRGPSVLSEVQSRRREHQAVIDTLQPLVSNARFRGRPVQLARAFASLGFAYEQIDDVGAAIDVYRDALALMPGSLGFQARLAQAYITDGRNGDATRVLAEARAAHPDNLTLMLIEAELHRASGDLARAEDLLQAAVATNLEDPRGAIALASYYSERSRIDEAVSTLEAAQERFPADPSILFQLGAVFEQHERYGDAERVFRQVLDQDPEHAPTLNYLGYMLAERGERLDESVALIERAVETDPHNGSYLDSLGWAYFKLDRLDLAEPPLRAAGDQLLRNSVVQDHLGDLLLRLGEYAEAIAAWERALDGDGESVDFGAIEQKIEDASRRLDR